MIRPFWYLVYLTFKDSYKKRLDGGLSARLTSAKLSTVQHKPLDVLGFSGEVELNRSLSGAEGPGLKDFHNQQDSKLKIFNYPFSIFKLSTCISTAFILTLTKRSVKTKINAKNERTITGITRTAA